MHRITFPAVALVLSGAVLAGHVATGDLRVVTPWSRELPPVSDNGVAYVTIVNEGDRADRLIGASTPIARRAELHGHTMEGGMMKMERLEGVDLPPGETVELAPGGLHLMLMGLKAPLVKGDRFPLTLRFAHAPAVEVAVDVRSLGATGESDDPGSHGGHDVGGHEMEDSGAHDGAGTEKAHEHGDHSSAREPAAHDHERSLDLPAGAAPTLALTVADDAAGGYALTLETSRFSFSKEHADGAHVPGEGHAHLYVDGEKIGRVYGRTAHLDALAPGSHEIEVGLYTNDHAAYATGGRPVAERVALLVPEPGRRLAPGVATKRIDLAVRGGELRGETTIRVRQGERVELRWSADGPVTLHLHGYDVETEVAPRSPVTMRFDAVLTGRFPVEMHGSGHDEETIAYLEVHPG